MTIRVVEKASLWSPGHGLGQGYGREREYAFVPLTPESVGTYVSVKPDVRSKLKLIQIGRLLGFDLHPELEELHATIVYSKGHLPFDDTTDCQQDYEAVVTGVEFWPGHDGEGYLVATLRSSDLRALHEKWLSRGLRHSFEDYSPHVTLVKDCGILDDETKARVLFYTPKIIGTKLSFCNETVEGLKSNGTSISA